MRKFSVIILISIISAFFVQKCFAFDGVDVGIPVYYENSSSADRSCTVYMESASDGGGVSYKKIVESGTETNFDIRLDTAGIYDYKIYRDIGNDADTVYDKTVYFAEITVVNVNNGLTAAVNIYVQDGGKVKRASYIDKKESAPSEREKDKGSDETDKKDDRGSSSGSTSGKSSPLNKSNSITVEIPKNTDDPDTDTRSTAETNGEKTTYPISDDESVKISEETSFNEAEDKAEDKKEEPPSESTTAALNIRLENAVNTGDSNHQEVWLFIMTLSLIVNVGAGIAEKKAKK